MEGPPSLALARVVRGGDFRVAHARLPARRHHDAQAAHLSVDGIDVLAAARAVGEIDLGHASRQGAAQSGKGHGRSTGDGDHRVLRAFGRRARLDDLRRRGVRRRRVAGAGRIGLAHDPGERGGAQRARRGQVAHELEAHRRVAANRLGAGERQAVQGRARRILDLRVLQEDRERGDGDEQHQRDDRQRDHRLDDRDAAL